MAALPTIPEYYAGKKVFLTGATGFVGKVLIEKLLRSCPQVDSIYCLVRPKRGKSAEERIEAMLEEPLYDNLRRMDPDFKRKVQVVLGDILEENLGLKPEDVDLLNREINIVFHSAATIRFDEPLRLAVNMNVLAVRKMVQLVKNFTKLEVFLHVSTAFANCDRQEIEEVIYPSPLEPQKLISALEWLDDDMVTMITPKIIQGKPNTYTYTKQLAEALLLDEGKGLPIAIVRPSIVTASWKEPFAGWIDNMNGPSGLYIAMGVHTSSIYEKNIKMIKEKDDEKATGKGIMRSMKADWNTVADMIPVDVTANMILASSWYTATSKPAEVPVFHITSGALNPCTWGEMGMSVMEFFKHTPLEACFRRPNCMITTNNVIHDYWVLVSHLIPAYIADFGYRIMGKKPRMVSIYKKLHRAMQTLEWFTVRSWSWTHKNTDMLQQIMNPEDNKNFYLDPRGIHWPNYIENYCQGTKTYILKEDMSGLPAARAHIRRLRNIRYCFNTILLVVLWRLLIARSSLARNSWNLILGLVFKFVRFFRMTSTIS